MFQPGFVENMREEEERGPEGAGHWERALRPGAGAQSDGQGVTGIRELAQIG